MPDILDASGNWDLVCFPGVYDPVPWKSSIVGILAGGLR